MEYLCCQVDSHLEGCEVHVLILELGDERHPPTELLCTTVSVVQIYHVLPKDLFPVALQNKNSSITAMHQNQ